MTDKQQQPKDTMKTYTITTDAVTTTVSATSADDAAREFGRREMPQRKIETVGDLTEAAESLGGWARVIEQ